MKALTKTNTKTSLKNAVVVILFHLAFGQALFAATTDKDFILDKSAADGAGIVFKSSEHPSSRFWEIDNTSGRFRIFETGGAVNALSILHTNGYVGMGTSAPDRILEINSSSGGNIRLTYDDSDGGALNYADFQVDSNGALSITTVDAGSDTSGNIVLNPDGNLFIYLIDDIADALDIKQGSDNYINISTIDGTELIAFGNITTNPAFTFLGSGDVTVGGDMIFVNAEIISNATDGDFTITGNLVPAADDTYNLGSSSKQWKELHVASGTIYIGGVALTNNGGQLEWAGSGIESTSTSMGSLFVENTGTGNSLRVNDEASDGTPFVIKADGNVGIGTTAPVHKLVISDPNTTADRAGLYVTQSGVITGGTGYGIYASKTGASTTNVGGYFSATGATNNYGLIVGNGKVGIGTTTPSETLHVKGGSRFDNGTLIVENLIASSPSRIAIVSSGSQAGDDAELQMMVGGAAELADPYIWFQNNNTGGIAYTIGQDVSNDLFVIAQGFTLEATQRFVIDTGGDVGIGTTAPKARLHVKGANNTAWFLMENAAGTTDKRRFAFYGEADRLEIRANNDADVWQRSLISFDHDGKVGIGTTAPAVKLHIEGVNEMFRLDASGAGTGTSSRIGFKTNGDTWELGARASAANPDNSFYIYNGTDLKYRFVIDDDGDVGIGTTTPKALLHVGDNHQVLLATGGNAWVNSSVIETGFTAGIDDWTDILVPGSLTNTARLRLTKAGNVGIGTTAPSETLHVKGGSRFDNGTLIVENLIASSPSRIAIVSSGSQAGDDAELQMMVGGAAELADPYIWFQNNNTGGIAYTIGQDVSNDLFVIAQGFTLDATQRFVIDTDGDVGIGTTAPAVKLHIEGVNEMFRLDASGAGTGTSSRIGFKTNGDTWELGARASAANPDNSFYIYNNTDSEFRFVIDDSGNVGIGTTTPVAQSILTSAGSISVTSSDGNFGLGDERLILDWLPGADKGRIVATAGGGTEDTSLAFFTAVAGTIAERMIITSAGKVGIGTTAPAYKLEVKDGTSNSYVANIENTATGGPGLRITLAYVDPILNEKYIGFYGSGGQEGGSIKGGSPGVIYANTSDERLKANIRDTRYGLSDLMNVEVRDYEWRSGGFTGTGFIAQELYEVFPMAVSVGSDDVKEHPWGVDYGKLTPLIVIATQEQQEQIEELRAENSELRRLVERMNTRLTRLEGGWQRTDDRRQRTEDRRQMTEDGRQKTEDRRQRTENRGRKTEDRKQKTEDRRQRTEDR